MTWTRRGLLLGAGSAWLAAHVPVPARADAVLLQGPAFGTGWRAVLAPQGPAESAARAIMAIVEEIDAALSPFRADSDITRFNRADTTDAVPVSADCAAVVQEGLGIAAFTDGGFDPTVGGIVNRYGFGPIQNAGPARHTDISVEAGAIRKRARGATFDPCGIAKGHALDLTAARLADLGIDGFLIELGGEVTTRGRHPDGREWQVGIERPGGDATAFQRVVSLGGKALATSGDAVNGYDVAGNRYSHIIDPATHRPTEGGLASVSVIADTGMRADALATALYAMGPEAGPAFAERHDIAALFLAREGSGLRELQTGGFAPHIIR